MVLLEKQKQNKKKKLFLFEIHFLTSMICRLADKKILIK